MTDAELIALASLVNASCTEIAAANQVRHRNGQAPAYNSYVDLFGGDAMEQIHKELTRRKAERGNTAPKAGAALCEHCESPLSDEGHYACDLCKKSICGPCKRIIAEAPDSARPS